jgi:hypothetical protein
MVDLTEDLRSEHVEMVYGELDENLIFHRNSPRDP